MGTPCIPPYCFWMLTKGSQRSFLGASDTSHFLPVHFVKQTRGSNQVNDVLTVPHWLLGVSGDRPVAVLLLSPELWWFYIDKG